MKIIAESAFNHNGNMQYLKDLALKALESGADYFTIQIMVPDAFCTKNYSKYDIYNNNSFSENAWLDFFEFCRIHQINLIPCVLEENSFRLCYDFGFRFLKIHGTDLTNLPFLSTIKEKCDVKVIVETQCATYQDLELGFSVLGDSVDSIFHGYSDYPTELEELNLNAIKSLRNDFPLTKFGFADHSPTVSEIPLMAMALGYNYLEKHITLTRNNRNFDWQVSLYPEEFSIMVKKINFFTKALGNNFKHPSKKELNYRNIIYKKVLTNSSILKRNDSGTDYLTTQFKLFDKTNIGIAIVARLKSQRLKKKVLKEFGNKTMIEDLFLRLTNCKNISSIKLATSNLDEDSPLVEIIGINNSFLGHPISVIDRLLSLARIEKLGGIIRVTGDNPFTEPKLIDEMTSLFLENNLDYVRVNNVPFGISAELFSVSYLFDLYKKMRNPFQSEYLSWFVLNDVDAKKGCINFIPKDIRISKVNLSIDYEEDYLRSLKILERINKSKFELIKFSDIISNLDLQDLIDENKIIKLPEGKNITFSNYLDLMNKITYDIKKDLHEEDIYNW